MNLLTKAVFVPFAVICFVAATLTTGGCKPKEDATATTPGAGKATAGAADTVTGSAKPEQWQIDAKNKAEKDGPAIQAAMEAQQRAPGK